MLENYIYKENRKLRCGYTTGSCAAAATKAAVKMALTGLPVFQIHLMTPKGVLLDLKVKNSYITDKWASCAIQKDGGDDVDVTHHLLIYSSVELKPEKKGIQIEGGIGVGRVTEKGLDQPVGAAAINRVPRQMIAQAASEICDEMGYEGGLLIEISVPRGEEIAKKTLNPQLGIEGGISILGTSGIVEPMSERALVDTIETEIKMCTEQGAKWLILTPGNYGMGFLKDKMKISVQKNIVKCSNFIGETIDMAYPYQLKGILLIGHIGKLVKLGAGIMNTHSKWGDGRMEILASCALLADVPNDILKQILRSVTTDQALELLAEAHYLELTMEQLMKKIDYHLRHRICQGCQIGAMVFSNQLGLLGKTDNGDFLLEQWKRCQETNRKNNG